MTKKVFSKIRVHCKLGLTATMVREDNKIDELNFLVGSKLYEANWIDLARAGHIATVSCCEVQCEMSSEFMKEYLQENNSRQLDLVALNPNKFRTCEFLIKYHEKRGDKVIVFADRLIALQYYSVTLRYHNLSGKTGSAERTEVLAKFRDTNSDVNCIFLSSV